MAVAVNLYDCKSAPTQLKKNSQSIGSEPNADIAALSNTNSSPPYSQAGTEQMQYSTPESCTDQRTETPSSDQLNAEFNTSNDFSPDNGIGSDRDPSPDCVSTSSAGESHLLSAKTISAEDAELQRQILRLQSFSDDVSAEKKPTLNLLSSFHNSPLLAEKLASCMLPAMQAPQAVSVPLAASLNQTPNTHEVTPTKRKRQRRNPVWPYFDVIDGTARCKQCLYSTKSVFSTNLKVHLRSHHRADYEKVIQAEDALNLNALLLSGNSSKLFSTDLTRKRMPPMTSSILMTINKCKCYQITHG
ncbi:unnamed protein product [Nippostrongylus brasiliensis]|uniref:BED-type domain-containing protein n=1 Tax=Nippostrongylus brasiliensis TaxID=27835 RepID=A0A0N4YUP3_NIPBR|nr:unnamed protein product [Nippostrongylus brasiliensis]